tara:strand:+ start:172 stop:477 length:306 start_codon:yes stop_codon:yes gene_type:complete
LNRAGNYVLSKITSSNYTDFTCGFKCYRAEKLLSLGTLSSDSFSLSLEISLKLYLTNAKIAILGHNWKERNTGKSKFNIIKESILYAYTIVTVLTNFYNRK